MTVRIGLIGSGLRVSGLAGYLAEYDGLKIHGLYDPAESSVRAARERLESQDICRYASWRDLVNDPAIDWVMVGSPNALHKEHICGAFAAGKHVFSEKPIATAFEDCRAIVAAHEASGRLFATGFCMRYTRQYRKAREILASGRLGRVISVDGNENINPGHGAYIMANWRRHKALSGPHILEKCVHDLDLLNWMTGSIPRRVAAFGGTDFFVPENRDLLDRCPAFRRLERHWDPGTDPFTSDKTIEDNLVAILEYYNGARAQFQATACNSLPERRLYFHCSNGNLVVEQYQALLRWQALDENEPHEIRFDDFHDAHLEGYQKVHAEGDRTLVEELADSMLHGTPPQCSGREGLLSAVTGIAIDRAREEGRVFDLDSVWHELGIPADAL